MFALTRNKTASTDLLKLEAELKNIIVLQADIIDVPSLRVGGPHRVYYHEPLMISLLGSRQKG